MNLKQAEKLIETKIWEQISKTPGLPKRFIEKYKDRVNWHYILCCQKLSESFIEKYIEEYKGIVDWYYISQFQKISENFIEKYKDKLVWFSVSRRQKLSEKFIRKHESLLDLKAIFYNKKIPKGIIRRSINGEYFLVKNKVGKISVPLVRIEVICPVCAKSFISKEKINVCTNCKAVFVV